MAHPYSPKRFGALMGKSVATLQQWDREGILTAYRSLTRSICGVSRRGGETGGTDGAVCTGIHS